LALLMAAYHFLLLVTLYLLKPVRDGLFLSSRGPDELPFVFILTTAVVVPVAVLHSWLGKRMDLGDLIDSVSLFLVLSLVALRGVVGFEEAWGPYVLYAWVSIYGLLVTSQFWLLANELFTSSQSKRVFTVLSAGAICGAIVGGEITGLLVDEVGMSSENLLWVAGGVLVLSTLLERRVRTVYSEMSGAGSNNGRGTESAEDGGPFKTLRQSRHLRLIVGIITLVVIVATFVDFQFKTVAARAFPVEEDLTAFMGQFYGRVSVVALLVQFVLAPWLIRVVGVGGALSVLPGTLALGSIGMLVMPGLVMGILLRGAGQSLKHSVDRTGRELLFVPVSLEKKKRVKVFVDLFIDQGAEGLGGILLLILVVGLGLDVQMLSVVILTLIAVWGVLAYRARESYVDQFRLQLRQEGSSRAADTSGDTPGATLDDLVEALCSRVEEDVLGALDTLESETLPVPAEAVQCLLDHPSADVRERSIRVLRVREVEGAVEEVAEALRDLDPDVQLEAARYLYNQDAENHDERLRKSLEHDDPRIQAATVGLISKEGTPEEYALVDESLLRRLVNLNGEERADTRTHAARILGVLDRPYRNRLLRRLLRDDEPSVVRAAIKAASRTSDHTFVYRLVQYLSDETFQEDARAALVDFGPTLLGTLYDYLIDPRIDLEVRRQIPSIFVEEPCQLAVTLLVRSLRRVPIPVRYAVVRALSKLHKSGDFERDPALLDTAVEREIEHYAALGQILHLHRRPNSEVPTPVTLDLLPAYREEALERIFRLLGLRYDQRDIYDAYLGITSDEPALRDSAVEFVDNLIDYGTRRYLLPLLDDPKGERAVTAGARFFNRRIRDWEMARDYLKTVDDPRLTALVEAGPSDEIPVPDRPHGDDDSDPVAPSRTTAA